MALIELGTTAPDFKLRAIPTKRKVLIPSDIGVPMLLVFMGAQTATQLEDVVKNVRLQQPDPAQLLVVNVVDLRGVPKLLKKTAETVIRASYDQAAAQLPEEFDPIEHLILIPDWKGKIFKAFGVKDANSNLAIVALNGEGQVIGHFQGEDIVPAALEMISKSGSRSALDGELDSE